MNENGDQNPKLYVLEVLVLIIFILVRFIILYSLATGKSDIVYRMTYKI